MKNALNYYYNLNPTSIHQSNRDYRCYIDGEEYLLALYTKDNYNVNSAYELSNYLLQHQIPCHQIILNNNREIITIINNNPYILLKIFIKNRPININDILFFSSLKIQNDQFVDLQKNNWKELWMQKIDYLEYQISQIGKKYPIVRESINYYIGLAENSIILFNAFKQNINYDVCVCHQRINSDLGTIEFYNPLNFIVDNKTRDLSEFIKEQFFLNGYSVDDAIRDISFFRLEISQYGIFFARLFFPTYYFDCYEEVISGRGAEKELLKIINKNSKYLEFLKELYAYLKKIVNLPEIEWLKIG